METTGKWFLAKVKTQQMGENGAMKDVTHQFLFNAFNYTEAEAKAIEETKSFTYGTLDVVDIKGKKLMEIFTDNSEEADKWYEVKVNFITLDEKTATEKKTAAKMLVQASNIANALDNFNKGMHGSMMDFDIAGINETKIEDVYFAK